MFVPRFDLASVCLVLYTISRILFSSYSFPSTESFRNDSLAVCLFAVLNCAGSLQVSVVYMSFLVELSNVHIFQFPFYFLRSFPNPHFKRRCSSSVHVVGTLHGRNDRFCPVSSVLCYDVIWRLCTRIDSTTYIGYATAYVDRFQSQEYPRLNSEIVSFVYQ